MPKKSSSQIDTDYRIPSHVVDTVIKELKFLDGLKKTVGFQQAILMEYEKVIPVFISKSDLLESALESCEKGLMAEANRNAKLSDDLAVVKTQRNIFAGSSLILLLLLVLL